MLFSFRGPRLCYWNAQKIRFRTIQRRHRDDVLGNSAIAIAGFADPNAKNPVGIVRNCVQLKLGGKLGVGEKIVATSSSIHPQDRSMTNSGITECSEDLMGDNSSVSPVANPHNFRNDEVGRHTSAQSPAEEMPSSSDHSSSKTLKAKITNLNLGEAAPASRNIPSLSQAEENLSEYPWQSTFDDIGPSQVGIQTPTSCRVAVIGAGASGLVAARELVREGHEVVVFEQGDEVGGVWHYTDEVENDPLGVDPNRNRVHSSLYKSLRTNLPREIMSYTDFPFLPNKGHGRDGRRFCNHREVATYLHHFARDYDIVKRTRFGMKVVYVGQQADKKWVVKFGKSETTSMDWSQKDLEVDVFDAVVVCNGHYFQPRVVDIPGIESWPGEQIHSHNYRVPRPFQDKVVVAIGSAWSARDISTEVSEVAKEVHQCARAWNSIELSTGGTGPRSNLWLHPMVERACPDGSVRFLDGTSVLADIILYCTGYSFAFPFLDTKGYVSVDDNRVDPLYKHVFPPALAPTLSFVGVPWKIAPFILMELQSTWIARLLSGAVKLPSEAEMMADVKILYDWLEAKNTPKSYTHCCGTYQNEYKDWLARLSGRYTPETWRKEIYLATAKNIRDNPGTYRDEWQDQELMEFAMAYLEEIEFPSKGQ